MIRVANVSDCVALAELDLHDNPSAWTVKQFQAACKSVHDSVLIHENEYGECMGFIVWQTICDEMELHLIATAPKFRRQGVASALLAQMFQAAHHQQISRILLEVRASNIVAQTLYTQFGFHEIALRKRYYNNTEDAVIMEKIC